MVTMTVMPRTHDWTVDDLDDLPDDGFRYELVDGVLLVSPSPVPRHQRVLRSVFLLLHNNVTPELEVFFAPLDFRPTDRRSLEPDALVVRREDIGPKNIQAPLLLAVEVLSPGTRSVDLTLKRHVYEESGVASYWLVDPEGERITVLELGEDGRYAEVAVLSGDDAVELTRPFPVRLSADLLRE